MVLTGKIKLTKADVLGLPQAIGVYIFKKDRNILYVGKSVSLKARILSHLENAKLDLKESSIVKNSNSLEYYLTDSEFKALLLESHLIQKYRPKSNSRWRDDKSYLYIKITIKDEYPKIFVVRKEDDRKSLYFGPFPSRRDAETVLSSIRRIFQFCSQKKIGKTPCFYSKIGLCSPCPNEIIVSGNKPHLKQIYSYNIRQIIKVLEGNVQLILDSSYKKLKNLALNQDYEQAIALRDKIILIEKLISQKNFADEIVSSYDRSSKALDDLFNFLKKYIPHLESLKRIECYDVSNIYQEAVSASMVVFADGMPDRSSYRKFKIKDHNARSDIERLENVFKRRFNNDWPLPNLIVVDGGKPQVSRIKTVLFRIGKKIPLMGIAKHPDRLILCDHRGLTSYTPDFNHLGFNLIRYIRDEAHRFARKYHLFLRNKKMLQ